MDSTTEVIDAATGEITKTAAPAPRTIVSDIPHEPAPDAVKLNTSAQARLVAAQSTPVTTLEEYQLAAEDLSEVKSAQARLEAQRLKVAGPLHKAWTAFNAMFKGPAEALQQAEATLKTKLLAFDQEQERLRREAEARQRQLAEAEVARQKAEADRLQAESQAAAAALQAQADAAARAAEEAAAAGNVEAVAAAQQVQQEAQAQAEMITTAAAVESAVRASVAVATVQAAASAVVIPAAAKVKGLGKRTKWVAEVSDKLQAVKFIAEHPEYLALLDFNESQLNKLADAQREGFKFPGITAKQQLSLSSRAA